MMGKLGNHRELFFLVLVVLLVAGSGCATKIFKQEILKNDQPDQELIRQIAKNSPDIISFANKIYDNKIESDSHHLAADRVRSSRVAVDFDEVAALLGVKAVNVPLRSHLNVFETYCSSKNGTLHRLTIKYDEYAFSRVGGVLNDFITCEVGDKLNSALFFYEYSESNDRNFPYRTVVYFIDSEWFGNFLKNNALFGYQSQGSLLMVPGTSITAPDAQLKHFTSTYAFYFNHENRSNTPQEIDLLNSSFFLEGKEYRIGAVEPHHPIQWVFNSGNKAEGVFVGEGGSKFSKLRFNPGQSLKGFIIFKLPGIGMLSEKDLRSFVFNLDGNKQAGFKKVSYYDLFKTEFRE